MYHIQLKINRANLGGGGGGTGHKQQQTFSELILSAKMENVKPCLLRELST